MEISGKVYFVSDPRRIEDLTVLHLVEKERPYEVVKTVKLAKIDYENFITDMVADRQFIEDHAALCSKGKAGAASWCSSAAAQTVCLSCRRTAASSAGRRITANEFAPAMQITDDRESARKQNINTTQKL